MMLGPGALQYPRVLSAMGSIVICVLKIFSLREWFEPSNVVWTHWHR